MVRDVSLLLLEIYSFGVEILVGHVADSRRSLGSLSKNHMVQGLLSSHSLFYVHC